MKNNKRINKNLTAWLNDGVTVEKLKKLALKVYEDIYDNFNTEIFLMLDTDGNVWAQHSKCCYENEIAVFSMTYIQPELYGVESMSENEVNELEKELYMDNADSVINDLMYGIDQTIDFLS